MIEINNDASFVSNILAVAKPNSLNILNSKFDKHVLKGSGENLNRSRLCIDIRNLNKRISQPPPVALPKLSDVKFSLHNHLLSTLDISSMFYSVQVDNASSKFLGFYSPFDDQIFLFRCLIMGLANAPYIAVSALRMLFTEENWQKFKWSKGNPDCAEGLSVECILIYYIDDILIYTAKNKGYTLHLLLLEFIFHQLNV